MSQERMKALVKEALNKTVEDLHCIDLGGRDESSQVEGCDTEQVAGVLASHLCALMYGKGGPGDA